MPRSSLLVAVLLALACCNGLRAQGSGSPGGPSVVGKAEPGREVEVELRPGDVKRFEYTASVDGEASVWARSSSVDARLIILDQANRHVAHDDDSGGGTTAHVLFQVVDGERYVVTLLGAESKNSGGGTCRLRLEEAPSSDADRRLAESIAESRRQLGRLLDEKDLSGAGQLVLRDSPAWSGASEPMPTIVLRELDEITILLAEHDLLGLAEPIWRMMISRRRALLPEGHPQIRILRANVAHACFALGRFDEAESIERELLAETIGLLHEDHPDVQEARLNLALTLVRRGHLADAAELQSAALRSLERRLPPDHPQIIDLLWTHADTLVDLCRPLQALPLKERVVATLERSLPADDLELAEARTWLAHTLIDVEDSVRARELLEEVIDQRSRVQGEGHLDLLLARRDLGLVLEEAGELGRARHLAESVLESLTERHPKEQHEIQRTRVNLASVLRGVGEFDRARSLQQEVFEVWSRTLHEDDPELQLIRSTLAMTLMDLGEIREARGLLDAILAVRERTLPDWHTDLAQTRQNLAILCKQTGDWEKAAALERQAIESLARALSEENPAVLALRMNHAVTLKGLGQVSEAMALERELYAVTREHLSQKTLVRHQVALNYASTLQGLGRIAEARRLQEEALEALSGFLPRGHGEIQRARQFLAATLGHLGDLQGARALEESALAESERLLPEGHVDLQTSRVNFSFTLANLGEHEAARALQARVVEVWEQSRPDSDPLMQQALMALAASAKEMGDLEQALEIETRVLRSIDERNFDGFRNSWMVRNNMAKTLGELGEHRRALDLVEESLERMRRLLPETDPSVRVGRQNHVAALLWASLAGVEVESAEIRAAADALLDQISAGRRVAAGSVSIRESFLFAASPGETMGRLLSIELPEPHQSRLERRVLEIVESLRALPVVSARLIALLDSSDDEFGERLELGRRRRGEARAKLAAYIARPRRASSEEGPDGPVHRLAELVRETERAERDLVATLSGLDGAAEALRQRSSEEIARALPRDAFGVSYVSHELWRLRGGRGRGSSMVAEEHLSALVLFADGTVERVELGLREPLDRLIERFLVASGSTRSRGAGEGRGISPSSSPAAALGKALRRRLIDPVRERAPEGLRRMVASRGAALSGIPLDALVEEDGSFVGDRLAIDLVPSLAHLAQGESSRIVSPGFLAVGGLDYGTASRGEGAGVDTGWGPEFEALPASGFEARRLVELFREAFGEEAPAVLLSGAGVDDAVIARTSTGRRYVHLATHGWFAPSSVPSLMDDRERRGSSDLVPMDFRDQVRGFEPLALCGLALSGANLSGGFEGRHGGLLTGNELASLDLGGCELVVLSTCDSGVGVERAGHGAASLQEAALTAGAHSSVTSLWRVPDEVTMELMTRFYRGVWCRGETKREALWNAKRSLREEIDPVTGQPRHGPRDWAGWVLVGNPE